VISLALPPFCHCEPFWAWQFMPYAFPRCHCEEALAEADAAIQSGSLCALPVVPLDCRVAHAPRNDRVSEAKGRQDLRRAD
jgi:hypothetical protein